MPEWTLEEFTADMDIEMDVWHLDGDGETKDCPDPSGEECPGHWSDAVRVFWVDGPSWISDGDTGNYFNKADGELFLLANKHRAALIALDASPPPTDMENDDG